MRTPITYYGGKQTMLKHILPLIPEHELYTESFCGGAAVLFAKSPAPAEIINDLNSELIDFYWIAKTSPEALRRRINAVPHSRGVHEYATFILNYPSFFERLDRAWAVWYRCKTSFASKLDGSFGYDLHGMTPKKLSNAKEDVTDDLLSRLDNVTIECRDALEVISTYDREDAFHFVDPPYINSNCGHYANIFDSEGMTKLLELLSNVKGKFMLTMFPYDEIEQFALKHSWEMHKVERTISASKVNRRKQEEWIIVNYDINAERGVRTLFD